MIRKILRIIGEKNTKKFFLLLVVMFLGSFLEILGVSLIVPLCSLLLDSSALMNNEIVLSLYKVLKMDSEENFIIFIICLLIIVYLFKTVYLLSQYYYQAGFVKRCKDYITKKVYRNVINRPYEYFTRVNTAEVTRTIYEDINQFSNYLNSFVRLITEILVVICMGMFLLFIDTKMTMLCCGVIIFLLIGIRGLVKKKVYNAGVLRQSTGKDRIKWLNQTVHGIKDIKIGQTENFFLEKYQSVYEKYTTSERFYNFWLNAPTYCIEGIVMILVLLYIMYLAIAQVDLISMLPSLSAFALAAVRLLPACNRINGYITQMTYTKSVINTIYNEIEEMDRQIEKDTRNSVNVLVKDNIVAKKLKFSYERGEKPVFEDADVEIKIGKSYGIIGASGAGKTTIMDVLLGLLTPQGGEILVDGIDINDCYKSFLDKVAYIPQLIFLMDDSIRNNIAFGIEEKNINDEKIWKVLHEAKLDDFVRSLPDGLDSEVGDRGIRLSGGQRQRIGIARALYSDCEIMLFDEATSALDAETEAAIMDSINSLMGKKTLIIIAHRLSTIEECDYILKVENGKVEVSEK